MGCPGQARTKPRRKLAVASQPKIRRTAAAAANIACGAWPHAAAPSAASSSARHGAQSRPARNNLRTGCRPVSGHRAEQRPTIGRYARPARGGAAACGSAGQPRLAPTNFTRKPALETVGGGRSSIRSTTGIKTPSSACTRRPDEFSAGGNTSARWPEQVRRRAAATMLSGGDGGVRLGGEEGAAESKGLGIGYPRMKASGESSTTKHRLLHASGSHPIPPPKDPKTNQYNQDLGLIYSTNDNHLESPNEGSSIDHQVTIHLHAQSITMFPTNETWYVTSQMLVSSSGGLILILTAQSTRNEFRMHSDY
ncbi:hypothetical protein F511_10922 [Dorcoceras hygrometricum]|uniref:Uncharacterized protein n=1 Tax=Dorcoceras hygrometricum TaxID=472368 RepID=A0A2Z7CQN7_9LAMI|nr:hypothetical protein F511_10922 [Dorcoceras hygrometricum]